MKSGNCGQNLPKCARVSQLEAKLETQATAVTTAQTQSAAAVQQAAAAEKTANKASETKVAWKGAPEMSAPGGWSFKPRGRMQIDVAGVDVPDRLDNARFGYGTEFRRLYLGFDGSLPGNLKYRIEADLANNSVEITDAYLTWGHKQFSVTAGQIKPFWGLEEVSSDLFTSMMERSSFSQAFGFERRVGLSGQYAGKTVVVQAGAFADNANDLLGDTNNSYSLDGRIVFMPKLGETQLHIGGSIHDRHFNDQSNTSRYRARPFAHTTDTRLVDTAAFTSKGETGYGLELGAFHGPLHAMAESYWQTANRPGPLIDPTFNGGYAELGYYLTGDARSYKAGVYDRTKPIHPVSAGGIGAIELNGRFDWLDLNDAGIRGGRQKIYGASLVWVPTDYTRVIVNYGHVVVNDSPVNGGGSGDYSADTVGMRAQFDF